MPLLVILSASEESRYASIVTPANYQPPATDYPPLPFRPKRSGVEWGNLTPIQFPAASLKIYTLHLSLPRLRAT